MSACAWAQNIAGAEGTRLSRELMLIRTRAVGPAQGFLAEAFVPQTVDNLDDTKSHDPRDDPKSCLSPKADLVTMKDCHSTRVGPAAVHNMMASLLQRLQKRLRQIAHKRPLVSVRHAKSLIPRESMLDMKTYLAVALGEACTAAVLGTARDGLVGVES